MPTFNLLQVNGAGRLLFTSFGSDNGHGIPGALADGADVPECEMNVLEMPAGM